MFSISDIFNMTIIIAIASRLAQFFYQQEKDRSISRYL